MDFSKVSPIILEKIKKDLGVDEKISNEEWSMKYGHYFKEYIDSLPIELRKDALTPVVSILQFMELIENIEEFSEQEKINIKNHLITFSYKYTRTMVTAQIKDNTQKGNIISRIIGEYYKLHADITEKLAGKTYYNSTTKKKFIFGDKVILLSNQLSSISEASLIEKHFENTEQHTTQYYLDLLKLRLENAKNEQNKFIKQTQIPEGYIPTNNTLLNKKNTKKEEIIDEKLIHLTPDERKELNERNPELLKIGQYNAFQTLKLYEIAIKHNVFRQASITQFVQGFTAYGQQQPLTIAKGGKMRFVQLINDIRYKVFGYDIPIDFLKTLGMETTYFKKKKADPSGPMGAIHDELKTLNLIHFQ